MNPAPAQSRSFALPVLLGIVALLAIGFALYESTATKQAEESLATAARVHEADAAQLQQLNKKLAVADQRQAEWEQAQQQQRSTAEDIKAAVADQAAKAAAKAADAARNGKAKALADGQAFLATFTQSHDMLVSIGKAQIGRNFAALIASGAIPPEQIEELEKQTAEHWIRTLVVSPGSIHPGEPNLPEDQVKAILGDQSFQQFQNYQRMQPLQGLVNDISSLSISAPLSREQSAQLMSVLASASGPYVSGGKADPQSVDWNQVLPQAKGLLSEAQMEALKAEAQLPQLMTLVKQFYQNQPPAK